MINLLLSDIHHPLHMESVKINKAQLVEAFTAKRAAIVEQVKAAAAANQAAISEALNVEISSADTYSGRATTKEVAGKSFTHLRVLDADLKDWLDFFVVVADATIEVDESEARELASLLASEVTLKDIKLVLDARVYAK